MRVKIPWVFGLAAALYLPVGAQDLKPRRPVPSVRATGEAIIQAKPDRAEIDIGVVTQAQSAQAAGAENAKQVDAALAEIRKLLGSGADIRTAGYSLTPNYRYPGERGGRPQITGYTANNTVEVRTGDLASVGKLIDLTTQAGANNIRRLQFTLKDEQEARSEAIRQAAAKARSSAEAMAAALGVKIIGVLLAEESGGPVQPYMRSMAAMDRAEAAPPTPIEPGTVDVRATVTLTLEVAP